MTLLASVAQIISGRASHLLAQPQVDERTWRRFLVTWSVATLLLGGLSAAMGWPNPSQTLWLLGVSPILATLAVSIARDFRTGRVGVDAIALISMSAAVLMGETLAAAVVGVMYAGGTALEDFAIARAQRDLKALSNRAPRIAHRLTEAGLADVAVTDIAIGDRLIVRSGEVVPVDGVVPGPANARATIDASVMTGEPLPVTLACGAELMSGTINAGATFEMRATRLASESAYSSVLRLVSAAHTSKAPFIRMADRYALLLLPVTLGVAGLTYWLTGDPRRALAVMVAATPCPLILAAPVAFVSGVARAARRGILVKGSAPLEAMATATTVVFDKTGTLTVGGAEILAIEAAPGRTAQEVLHRAASLGQSSPHILSRSLAMEAERRSITLTMPSDVCEDHGAGLSGTIDGCEIKSGSRTFVSAIGPSWSALAERATAYSDAMTIFVSEDGKPLGLIVLGDALRPDTHAALDDLRRVGVDRVVMLTGDQSDAARTMAAAAGIEHVRAECSPAVKLYQVSQERRRAGTVMVGDGINDAPALAAADVGIALGARGSTASSEAADVVIMVDDLARIPEAFAIAKRTRAIAVQSVGAGLALSGAAMALAAAGYLSPVVAAFSQEAIDLAVILNALRALSGPSSR